MRLGAGRRRGESFRDGREGILAPSTDAAGPAFGLGVVLDCFLDSHFLDFHDLFDFFDFFHDLFDFLDFGRLLRAKLEMRLRIILEGDEEDLLFEGQVDGLGRMGGDILVWRKRR